MKNRSKNCLRAIGLMSGTSMDGIDLALLETDGEATVMVTGHDMMAYDAAFRNQLAGVLEDAMELSEREARPKNLAEVERIVTERHAQLVNQFLNKHGLNSSEIDIIGFHGQTVLHRPDEALTIQLGDGDLLAKQTSIDVVYDMRASDMLHGGQGAPLVPVYHRALASMLSEAHRGTYPVCFVNIGGISNITYVGQNKELLAFDSGPGNALIDQWVQAHAGIPFDQGGMIASEGGVITGLIENYLNREFFQKPAPKSLDRNDFSTPQPEEASLEDGARTLARLTGEAIFKSVDHLPEMPKLWIICGGGRLNPSIMSDLHDLAGANNSAVITAEEAGFNGDTMEAEAWAYLAVRSFKGLPLTFPGTTGCRQAVTGGVLAKADIR